MSSVVKDGVRLAALLAGIVASASAAPGQSTQPEGQSKSVVYLTIHHYTNVDTDLRLLPRELYRQALLIAARDEMGLSTRDQALREWKNDPPAGVTLDMPYVANELRIESPAAPGAVLWGYTPPSRKLNEEMNLPAITKAAEKLSREDFVTVLQANGWQAAARPAHNDLPAPQDAEKLLGHLEELSQFAALREAHEAIRQSGESPARLGVLVRAYANLGSLTQFHWSVEDKVYSARALLYSQRMVSEYPKSADALWHRAYARALAGLLGPAQHDCDAAAAFHQGDTPPWALPLSAFCNYKVGDLTQLAVSNPDSASLTMYLAFLSVERSGAQGAYMGLAQAALSVNPDCLRLIDAMCADTGPGMLNELSVRGPTIFSRILAWELEKMPGLPRDIAKSMGELRRAEGNLQRRESICQDLIASGSLDRDQMEPSLAALGRLIQETTFAHIRRRADTLAIWLGINATDYVTEVRPFIADHPFRYLIEAYSHTRELAPHAVRDELAKQPWEDVKLDEYRLYGMENETGVKGPGTSRKFWFTLEYDPVARDLEEMARRFFNSGNDMKWPWILETLEDAAPESPRLLALKIQFQWSDDKAVEWERAHGDHPTVAMALGRKYIRLKRWADAERCIRQYIAVSPDRFGYQELADVYLSQHDDDRWLSTLKEYLEKPDYGLQHAQIQNEIAIHFMLRREYDRAVPYADAAAQTGWEIGLLTDAEAHTRIGDFPRAEELLMLDYHRYTPVPLIWYNWCIHTGHGDTAAATAAMNGFYAMLGELTSGGAIVAEGDFDECNGKYPDAMKIFRRAFDKSHDLVALLHLILLADKTHEGAALAAAFKSVDELKGREGPYLQLCKLLETACRAGPDAVPDDAALDKVVSGGNGVARGQMNYVIASFLDSRRHWDQALIYLHRCYGPYTEKCIYFPLPDQILRSKGINPLKFEAASTEPAATEPETFNSATSEPSN